MSEIGTDNSSTQQCGEVKLHMTVSNLHSSITVQIKPDVT